jgi:hypothetical protein
MGRLPGRENVYVATGHFRNGILLAPITGKLMSQLIRKGERRCRWSRSAQRDSTRRFKRARIGENGAPSNGSWLVEPLRQPPRNPARVRRSAYRADYSDHISARRDRVVDVHLLMPPMAQTGTLTATSPLGASLSWPGACLPSIPLSKRRPTDVVRAVLRLPRFIRLFVGSR